MFYLLSVDPVKMYAPTKVELASTSTFASRLCKKEYSF